MVPTFQVKGKHICAPREVRHSCLPVFVLTCILWRNLLTHLKSRMSLFFPLACTDTDKGLTIRGGTLVCKTWPDSTKSWIASSTNSACERDDLLFLKTASSGKLTNSNKYPIFYNVKDKARSSNTLPKLKVSTKISSDVDTRRTSTKLKLKQFTVAMYLRDISNLVIKNITALYQIDCGLREWVCRSCMNILG